MAVSLPGLAALAALLFTWMQVGQTSKELRITEQGQITNRFNAAIGNLGSTSLDVRLGGIYSLQRIMQDSVRDHLTVVSVLAAFVRQHAGASSASEQEPVAESADAHTPTTDVRAAIAVLARRSPERDGGTPVDLGKSDLRGLRFTDRFLIRLPRANLSDVDLRWADLAGADLHGADLSSTNLEVADLTDADLRGAVMSDANLINASLTGADLRKADMTCSGFIHDTASGTETPAFCTNLQYAFLDGTDLRNAHLTGADLRNADLTGADLRNADLSGAKLTGANLKNANLTGTRGLPASVKRDQTQVLPTPE
ncbi:pentapeptide repeat-containing protein [Streptomyces sp. NBC_00885]|uniref:pentapeptide repeat-containing protein n=1 Tax=Streptomyces sp. NBC_00885 TaxID=2975857 RepID=UPI0038646081|nr:pentapeptide repeat-containing protein [Streptomyces sp. NBC_00885]